MKIKNKRIFLSGYYGIKNTGDDFLLQFFLQFFRMYFPNSEINVEVTNLNNISKNLFQTANFTEPTYSKSRYKIIRVFSILKNELINFRSNDLYIYGGGTRLFETTQRTYKSLALKYLVLKFNNIFYKKPVYHISCGIGQINSFLGRFFLKGILDSSTKILLRDSDSVSKANKYIRTKKKVALSADMGYLLAQNKFIRTEPNKSKINIGLSLFQYYDYIEINRSKGEEFELQIISYIRELIKQNHNVYLFSFQKEAGGFDEEFACKIKTQFITDKVKVIPYEFDYQIVLNKMRSMDYLVGMRYHFCLFGFILQKPTIGISYQPKVRNEFEDLNLLKWCISITSMDQLPKLTNCLINETMQYQNEENYFKIINKKMNLLKELEMLVEFEKKRDE